MSRSPYLAIGAVAEATGVSVTALRYYDEIGLIAPELRVGGKRRFGADIVGRVNFIRKAQDVGFSLDETRTVLQDEAGEWPLVVEDKLAELRQKRARLDSMIALLEEIKECGCSVVASCPKAEAWVESKHGLNRTKC